MFALIDCNNFYASCERVFRPDLRNKPIVVLSNNDGCVIARSNEAKLLGVPMAGPAYKLQQVFKEHNVHVFSSNYALYGDMSARVMNILSSLSPEIEIYSIDEAFLKFDGCNYINFQEHGMKIRKTVTRSTGIPISVGFAPTKALSKIANKIAKNFTDKLQGVYVIDTEEKRIKALQWTRIEDVWGIGYRNAKRLKNQDIITAFDFTQLSDEWVRKHMSVVGLRLKNDLEGQPTLDLEPDQLKKNIATTRSFNKNYDTFDLVNERVVTFAVTCAEKLRKQRSCCNALMVFVRSNRHRKDLEQYNNSVVVQLPFATNSNIEIAKYASQALKQLFREGYEYKKAGVIVMDFSPENEGQASLFENSNPKHKLLMETMDKLNSFMGEAVVRIATQDKKTWKMKQDLLSPRYTTRFDEIMTAHV